MVNIGEPDRAYKPYLFLDQKRQQIAQIRKRVAKFGIDPNK